MKHLLLGAFCAAVIGTLPPQPAQAGLIASACVRSDREAASWRMCSCLQHVANQSLSWSDQRLAARFFRDPHMAQEVRQSSSRSHEIFWKRYKAFGETAEVMCKGVS